MLRKLGSNYQIALPRQIIALLRLKKDDLLDVCIKDGEIHLKPQAVIPKDQAYFFTPEWQKDERQADEEIKSGKITRTKNLDELFDILDGKKDAGILDEN